MITTNLVMQSKTRKKVEQHEIGGMLRQISIDNNIPGHMYEKLASEIEAEYPVLCTSQDVQRYEGLHMTEDYELESRRHGMQGRLRQMLSV